MGTKPKVILRRKNFGISKVFTPKMAEKVKKNVEAQKSMCPMFPNANFLVSKVELPKEKHIKNSG